MLCDVRYPLTQQRHGNNLSTLKILVNIKYSLSKNNLFFEPRVTRLSIALSCALLCTPLCATQAKTADLAHIQALVDQGHYQQAKREIQQLTHASQALDFERERMARIEREFTLDEAGPLCQPSNTTARKLSTLSVEKWSGAAATSISTRGITISTGS